MCGAHVKKVAVALKNHVILISWMVAVGVSMHGKWGVASKQRCSANNGKQPGTGQGLSQMGHKLLSKLPNPCQTLNNRCH